MQPDNGLGEGPEIVVVEEARTQSKHIHPSQGPVVAVSSPYPKFYRLIEFYLLVLQQLNVER